MLETRFGVGFRIGLFAAGYRLNGPRILSRIRGIVGTVGFVANLETGLFTAGYRLNGPSILCRIGGVVGLGGLPGIAPPEAAGSTGLAIMFPMSFSRCCVATVHCMQN